MATLDEVYRAFGYAAEAAQLLETELGTLLLKVRCEDRGFLDGTHAVEAKAILDHINRSTLGHVLAKLAEEIDELQNCATALAAALKERNRLAHHFFRLHNHRRNSDDGRSLMVSDLEAIHATIFAAYDLVLKVVGTDLDAIDPETFELPTKHLKLD